MAAARRFLRRFLRDRLGVVSVEFCFIFPLLLMFLFASVEGPAFIWARASVADAASAVGDLASQSTAINEAAATSVFLAAERMIDDEGAAVRGFTARLTSVIACRCSPGSDDFCFTVIWSHGWEAGALRAGYAAESRLSFVPQGIALAENETLIIAEASLVFAPKLSFVLDSRGAVLEELLYFRPRQSREVVHQGAFASPEPSSCPEE